MPELFFRPRTWDEAIWRAVAGDNEYGLPQRIPVGTTVIDIGAHIGAFSYACLDRGASLVVAIEADPENARLWQHNLHRACRAGDRSVLLTAACWRSDRPQCLRAMAVGENTGGCHVQGDIGQPVRGVGLDAVVNLACALAHTAKVDLVKLDCEGSEWPILFTTAALKSVDELIGEYHRPPAQWDGPRELPELLDLLSRAGFQTASHPTDSRGMGLFHAWRRTPLCQIS
jgi:FkbM family methyltransferase